MADLDRMQARALVAEEQFKASARESHERVPLTDGAGETLACPLSWIAARNGVLLGKVVTSRSTEEAPELRYLVITPDTLVFKPADSPKMVTFFGSPPKAAMLS